MIRTLLLSTAAILAACAPASAESTSMSDKMSKDSMSSSATAAYADVLARHITPGPDGITLFDYAGVAGTADHRAIEAFIAEQTALTPSTFSESEALAYWANLYNAVTLDVVLDEYPIKSIRQFGAFNTGPWDRELITVEGEAMSLNDIEHGTMREKYPTPYIHYMVNCASIGCPNLMDRLWSADTLEADKRAAARAYINSDRGLDYDGRTLSVSKIYKWYSDDFGSKDELRAHLATYATGEKLQALQSGKPFKGSHYDWDLNQAK